MRQVGATETTFVTLSECSFETFEFKKEISLTKTLHYHSVWKK
jgi:hypothetical protein